jgi:hypothetical protein
MFKKTLITAAVLSAMAAAALATPATATDARSGTHGNTVKIKIHPIRYQVLMDDIVGPLKSMQELKRKTR